MDNQKSNEFDILRGTKINEMERLFQQRLDEIETAYLGYFHQRPSKKATDECDKLHNHYVYHQSGNQSRLFWLDNSDLDQNIKDEVESAFKKIFVP